MHEKPITMHNSDTYGLNLSPITAALLKNPLNLIKLFTFILFFYFIYPSVYGFINSGFDLLIYEHVQIINKNKVIKLYKLKNADLLNFC